MKNVLNIQLIPIGLEGNMAGITDCYVKATADKVIKNNPLIIIASNTKRREISFYFLIN